MVPAAPRNAGPGAWWSSFPLPFGTTDLETYQDKACRVPGTPPRKLNICFSRSCIHGCPYRGLRASPVIGQSSLRIRHAEGAQSRTGTHQGARIVVSNIDAGQRQGAGNTRKPSGVVYHQPHSSGIRVVKNGHRPGVAAAIAQLRSQFRPPVVAQVVSCCVETSYDPPSAAWAQTRAPHSGHGQARWESTPARPGLQAPASCRLLPGSASG